MYRHILGVANMAWGQSFAAFEQGMAECMLNWRASYEHAATTPRLCGDPPTSTGFPLSSGKSSCSTDAKKASMSMCMILRKLAMLEIVCYLVERWKNVNTMILHKEKIALKYFFVSSIPTWNLLMKTILLKGTCDEETGND